MRAAFIQTLGEIAERDPRVMFLTGDLGFMAVEPFANRFPDRFVNAGVAEQNMVGMATGLAEAGFLPFVYSIVTFASLRPYEFIRNGPILHQLPVRIVGVGGGFEYGSAGPTHYGLEDVAVMRSQPGMTVLAPADCDQTRTALRQTWDLPGPIYYRIGKDDKTIVPGLHGHFDRDRVSVIRRGADVLLIGMGAVSVEVAAAAEILAGKGVSAAVAVLAMVNPPPIDDLRKVLREFPIVLTVEAHYRAGGLGSLIAEVIADHGLACRVVRCAVGRTMDGVSGGQPYLHRIHGLDRDSIAQTAEEALRGKDGPVPNS